MIATFLEQSWMTPQQRVSGGARLALPMPRDISQEPLQVNYEKLVIGSYKRSTVYLVVPADALRDPHA